VIGGVRRLSWNSLSSLVSFPGADSMNPTHDLALPANQFYWYRLNFMKYVFLQLGKKVPAFKRTRSLINVFITARICTTWIHIQPVYLISVLILSCLLLVRLCLLILEVTFAECSHSLKCDLTMNAIEMFRVEIVGGCFTFIHSFTGAYSPGWTFGLPFRGFLITHIQTHGRTPLDE
jgi:hypothetical protein